MSGALMYFMRLADELIVTADEIIGLSVEQDYPFFLEWGQNLKGWARVESGAADEGVTQMANRWKQGFSALLFSEVCIRTGSPDAGLAVIDEVIEKQPCYTAAARRVKGEPRFCDRPNSAIRPRRAFGRPSAWQKAKVPTLYASGPR